MNTASNLPDMIDTKEAARRLGLKTQTLNRWRFSGDGPRYYKVGGAVRYSPADLADFIIDPRAA
jgi:hypothetical protein